ncbi:amidohydrolase [Modestobacter sp. VKM Ac-2984]|uniref:amidohydrolase n=1 Tax=Modestobacter sp. VKM Ac-2984 TaxID=3004138 RepID=UPI0022AB1B77|nr:amidohydrolase family protein [Modestobacter sp. VKM Ac-2984]MCZ2816665.1 amidohydrolase family protein [Modestobacter sp. VKM Ac-2984]
MTALLLRSAWLDGRTRDVLVAEGRVRAIADDLSSGAPGLDRLPVPLEVVDLAGAVLLPGLQDAHTHLEQWAATQRRVDVSGAQSAKEAAALMAAALQAAPPAPAAVVLGHGFRDALWAEPATAAVLDDALAGVAPPDTSVVLVSGDLHTTWANTAATRRFGLSDPTGVVLEQEAMDVVARAARVDPAVLDGWVLDAMVVAAARGLTSVVDLEYGDLVSSWARRAGLREGGPALRVRAGVWIDRLEEAIAAGLRSGDPLPGVSDPVAADRVRMGPLKVFVDGSLGTRTAFCHDPYPGAAGEDAHGVLRTPPAELERLLRRGAAAGLDLAVHAIGDRAAAVALDGFAAAGCTGRIEHAQQVHDADLPRFAQLGVVASVQPRHALDDRDAADQHWAEGTARAFPYRSLVDAGAEIVLGSDAPVAPLDPWDGIASAVHRSLDDRPAWHPEQHLDLDTALAAASGGRRVVRVGDVADLVVVAEPPATVLARDGADGLRATQVLATLVGGRFTHRAPGLG